MIDAHLMEWLNLIGRAVHVVTGIAWIGASFYFIWLDNHLQSPAETAAGDRGVGGELWAVHGGGFYHAQKYRAAPPAMPARLHWFKWEAYSTLLSGLFLLGIVYYAQPAMTMLDPAVSNITPAMAVLVGVAWIVGGWIAYDALCRSPLGRNERVLAVGVTLLCVLAAYALCHTLSGRAAYLHFGAMLGTIMVLNVFFVIIPGQRALVSAAAEGRPVDPIHGARGKQRSVHNTYFTLPVVFTMIGNHYAWVYGAPWNWVWLLAISAAGALIRTWFVARHKGSAPLWLLVAAAALVAITAWGTWPKAMPAGAKATEMRAIAIVAERCMNCHAVTPKFEGLTAAPKGVAFDVPGQLAAHAPKVREQVATRAMPPGNLTRMTDAERAELLGWLDAQGKR